MSTLTLDKMKKILILFYLFFYSLRELASRCGISVKIVKSRLHFLNKQSNVFADYYEERRNRKVTKTKDLNEMVQVKESKKSKKIGERDKSYMQYWHKRYPGNVSLQPESLRIYNEISRRRQESVNENQATEFAFNETFTDGKLRIFNADDEREDSSMNESDENTNDQSKLLDPKFCRQFNLNLTLQEKSSVNDPHQLNTNAKYNPDHSNFAKAEASSSSDETEEPEDNDPDCEYLFLPYKEYWQFDCIDTAFSLKDYHDYVKKELPGNFRWLINECANAVEMLPYTVFKEVCFIENYLGRTFKNPEVCKANSRYLMLQAKKW